MTRTTLDLLGHDGDRVPLTDDQLEDLRARLSGSLLRPGEAGWEQAVRIWNGMVATTPALVVQPVTAEDVATTVRWVTHHGLAFSVKGGGHNIAGTAIVAGGVTIDTSRLREVTVDPDRNLVRVGAGCLLKHVDEATQQQGLATVLGFVSETGVAGLTLGGGFGYLTRRFGYTVDNLEKVEIVAADGSITTASRHEQPDLFWVLRGGGGNFGVVTRFTFRLHPVGPTITGGLIAWSAERADEVLAVYRDLTAAAPRELTVAVTIRRAPAAPFVPESWHGRRIAALLVCHSGENAERDLEPIRDLGEPIVDLVVRKPYVAQQSMLDPTQPKGLHYYWKTEFLPGLPDGLLDAFRGQAVRVASPMSQSIVFHLGGALNERTHDDGAVGNRDVQYVGGFAGAWSPDTAADEHVDWVREGWRRIRPFSTGGNYVNFQTADDGPERTAAAYGANLARLQEVKRRYDPHNLFRSNRNIQPAS
ncbi:MAG TPA: FAD-binding oxidoreductase [Nitriliruptorales bacterium]|nr:FAD-binding oxidoreductase [Nitriliruptorales bacterium]